MKYKVSHAGEELEPLAIDEIVAKVRSLELELFDYIFDEAKGDWVLFLEHPTLAQKLKSNKPPRPPVLTPVESTSTTATAAPVSAAAAPVRTTASGDGEWFVLKGEHRFGPFTHGDVVRMLQQKVVYPFDFIWNSEMPDWQRVAQVRDFHPDQIRTMFETSDKKTDVFAKRQHKRKKHALRVIIHDNLSLWKGESFEISKGGLGVKLQNALVVPGQQVFVHCAGGEGLPAFNAVCEVVSKKFVNDNSPVEYGLRFVSMSPEVESELNKKVN